MSTGSPLNDSFSRAMAYYKALTGKSNKDISDALHIPATTVSAWNTGRHLPDMDRLQRLATYLNAPLDQFFNFSVDKPETDKELPYLLTLVKSDEDLLILLKLLLKLSDEDRALISQLATKILK